MKKNNYQNDALRTESNDFEAIAKRLQNPETIRLFHCGIGLATEAGEFLDALKKHIFYGKEIDRVNLSEELGDIQWYSAIGADTLNDTLDNIQDVNIKKLKSRFPDKFTGKDALNRDLDKERDILEEGGM
jgi:NTP pyrophosphatase (non-canonical NTP hydrolase)